MARSSPLDLHSSHRSHHYFFKVFFPDQSSNHLRIPLAFREHIEATLSGKFSLKGPSGSVWIVNMVKNSDGFFFEDGWKEFVADQSLVTGDFLVFRYDGNSKFMVLVFDSTACEKKKAFFARPGGEEEAAVVEGADDEREGESVGKKEKALVRIEGKSKRKRGLDNLSAINGPLWKKKKQSQSGLDRSKKSKSRPDGRKGALATPKRSNSSPNGRNVRPSLNSRALATPKRTKLSPNGKTAHLRPNSRALATTKQMGKSHSPSSSSKSSRGTPRQKSGKTVHRNSVSSVRCTATNKKAKSEYRSGQVSRSGVCSSKTSTSKQSSKALALVKSSKMPCQEGASMKVLRRGSLVSQRRPVTEEEVSRTLQKAVSFKSKHPFAIQHIPSPFAGNHLPNVNTVMTVWDPNGKPWKITYISYANHGALSGGWAKFSFVNNLEKHDVCVLELIKKAHLKVHIFRVVEEITPLLRYGR